MANLITPDVRVRAAKPDKDQRRANKEKMEEALRLDNEIRLRIRLEVYNPDPEVQRYFELKGTGMIVRCTGKQAVECVVESVNEVVQALDQMKL